MKSRIVFFSHSANLYGAERSLLDLILGLPTSQFDVLVVVPHKGAMTDILDQHHIEYIIIHYFGWLGRKFILIKGTMRVLLNLLLLPIICFKLSRRNVDLIYTNTLYSPVGALVAWLLGVPHIWHFREAVEENMGAKFDIGTKKSMLFVNKYSNYIIFNSQAVCDTYSSFFPNSNYCVVYNGWLKKNLRCMAIDSSNIRKSKTLSIIGSLNYKKRQIDAIKAVAKLNDSGLRLNLNIVGSGNQEYEKELKNSTLSLGLQDQVKFFGYSDKVQKIIQESDVILLCSQYEPFGRVIIEAMSQGRPVVASAAGGVLEIIEYGYNGLLYETGNIDDLASKILMLYNDQNLYIDISQNGYKSAIEKYSLNRYVTDVLNVISKALGRTIK